MPALEVPALQVEQFRKTFGSIVAVDGISFSAAPGEIFGLLGPNGAGKSTTLNCVCGLLQPTSGRILVLDRDVHHSGPEARRPLASVPQDLALHHALNARHHLEYWA